MDKRFIIFYLVAIISTNLIAEVASFSPLSKDFIKWRNRVVEQQNSTSSIQQLPKLNLTSDASLNLTNDETVVFEGNGYIPPPFDKSHIKHTPKALTSTNRFQRLTASSDEEPLPEKYDFRDYYKSSHVKNQGSHGTCWAHAAIGCLESYISKEEDLLRDFSENHLVNRAGFVWGFDDGGNDDMATAYLARWEGPVAEESDPYLSKVNSTNQVPIRNVQQVVMIPSKSDYLDHDFIKKALLKFGTLSSAMYYSSVYYKSSTDAHYYHTTDTPEYCNHAILVVGWDDNFPSNSFKTAAPGNGAYIVKNSYGPSFGIDGYFYVSYYDDTLFFNGATAFIAPEPVNKLGKIYDYTPYGVITSLGYGKSYAQCATMFTAEDDDELAAASFYFLAPNISYNISIYTDCTRSNNPQSGKKAYTQSGVAEYAGYETIYFDETVSVKKGTKFSIVFELDSPNYIYPIPLEVNTSDYLTNAVSAAGQSFIKGNSYLLSSWTDIYGEYSSEAADVCIKAFTKAKATQTSEVRVPYEWLDQYPELISVANGDYESAANSVAANGLYVYENYLVGLDPTSADSKFNANIVFTNNVPQILWEPRLNPRAGQRQGLRWYTVYGKKQLDDEAWEIVDRGHEDEYNFFKVGVELP